MSTAWACLTAVLLDTWLGDPQRAHPLGDFLKWADAVEKQEGDGGRFRAIAVAALTVLPFRMVRIVAGDLILF